MQSLMTVLAKRQAVINVKAECWMVGERFDMVRLKVSSAVVSAVLASILVTSVDGVSPSLVLRLASVALVALVPTMTVGVVVFPAGRSRLCSGTSLCGAKGAAGVQPLLLRHFFRGFIEAAKAARTQGGVK